MVGLLLLVFWCVCVLIDFLYEIKDDYDIVVKMFVKVYKCFVIGIYMIWYLVVDCEWIDRMEVGLIVLGMCNI